MRKINFRMIELARDSRGITQKELSGLLPKLNQPNLSKIERGELPISDEAIENIAKALDFPLDFFYQEETKSPVSSIYFRKRATVHIKQMNKIFADFKIILKGLDTILKDVDLYEYPKFILDISEGWTPKTVAIRMREIMKIPNGKPVSDLIQKIEELGIIVYFYDSETEKFDGLTAYSDDGHPVIFVNRNMPNDRLRFTIAHELFHLVMHIPCNVEPWRNYELEANQATSEFFMPSGYCESDLRNLTITKLSELKSYWGVSKAAVIRRAKDLSLIEEKTYKYFMIELGRRGERKAEQGYVYIDSPRIMPTVINLLKTELGYTTEDLSQKLGLRQKDYGVYFEPELNNVKLRVIKSVG